MEDLHGGSSRKGEKDGASRYLAMNHADWRRARARVPSFSSSSSSSFFSLSLVATQEGSGYFWNPSSHPHFDPSIGHSMTRLDVSFLHYSPKIFFERAPLRDATSSFPTPSCESACGTREQSFHPLSNRISLWIRQKRLTGTKPHVSTLSAIPVSNPRKLEAFERQIFGKELESTRRDSIASRLSPLRFRCQKEKKDKGTLSHFVDLDSAWISWRVD